MVFGSGQGHLGRRLEPDLRMTVWQPARAVLFAPKHSAPALCRA